jgi:hypothetical protein
MGLETHWNFKVVGRNTDRKLGAFFEAKVARVLRWLAMTFSILLDFMQRCPTDDFLIETTMFCWRRPKIVSGDE